MGVRSRRLSKALINGRGMQSRRIRGRCEKWTGVLAPHVRHQTSDLQNLPAHLHGFTCHRSNGRLTHKLIPCSWRSWGAVGRLCLLSPSMEAGKVPCSVFILTQPSPPLDGPQEPSQHLRPFLKAVQALGSCHLQLVPCIFEVWQKTIVQQILSFPFLFGNSLSTHPKGLLPVV